MGFEGRKRLEEPLGAPWERIGDCALKKDVNKYGRDDGLFGDGIKYLFLSFFIDKGV